MDTAQPVSILSITFSPNGEDPLRIEKEDTFGQIDPVAGPAPPPTRFDVELDISPEEKRQIDSRLGVGDEAEIVVDAVGHEDPLSFSVQRSVARDSRSEDYNIILTVVDEHDEKMLTRKLGV